MRLDLSGRIFVYRVVQIADICAPISNQLCITGSVPELIFTS